MRRVPAGIRLSVLAALVALPLAGCAARHVEHPARRTVPTVPPTTHVTSAPPTTAHRRTAPATPTDRGSDAPAPTAHPRPNTHPAPAPSAAPLPHVSGAPLVVLNPGHNGGNAAAAGEISRPVPSGFGQTRACDTTGTETNAGYPEHAFNWDVTLRVRSLLTAHGVRVLLTRPNDTGVGPCIDARSAIGNSPQVATAFVSIHADGAPPGGHGFHVCEDSRQPAGPAVAAQSHRLTVAVHDALVRGSGLVPSTYFGQNGYVARDDFAGLNLAQGPATFLELGNMRNAGDAALQSSPAGRQRVAEAIASGILAYLHG